MPSRLLHNLVLDFLKNIVNDYRLKSSIFVEVKDLRITGKSRLFVTPTTIQWWTVIKVDDYWLKEPIKRQNHF
jgi:hypothetical protein